MLRLNWRPCEWGQCASVGEITLICEDVGTAARTAHDWRATINGARIASGPARKLVEAQHDAEAWLCAFAEKSLEPLLRVYPELRRKIKQ